MGEIKAKEYDGDPEGWEYSKLFTTKFHPKERTFDMVRRRRWNRKLISDIPVPVVFSVLKVNGSLVRYFILQLYGVNKYI